MAVDMVELSAVISHTRKFKDASLSMMHLGLELQSQ
jgi:hypothetical protein